MLSSFVVRFFLLPPLRNTAASFVCPATSVPLRSTGAAPDERQRLQGQPLSWLLARSGLSWPPPYPLSGSRSSHLFVGCSRAPLVLRPCLVARPAVPCRSAKAHRVSPPHRCHPFPRWPYWCLPLRVRRRKRHARRRFGLKPCADSCRAGRAPWRERGAVVLIAVVVLRRSVCRSAETPA